VEFDLFYRGAKIKYPIENKKRTLTYKGGHMLYEGLEIFAGRSCTELLEETCLILRKMPGKIIFKDFSNGNIKVTITNNVRGKDTFVMQTGAHSFIDNRIVRDLDEQEKNRLLNILLKALADSPDQKKIISLFKAMLSLDHISSLLINRDLMELLIIIDALKSASAGRITAVMPYFFYPRSDKKDEGRISVTAKLVAKLIECAGAHRILTMDLHASQIHSFFDIPCDHLPARSLFYNYIREQRLGNIVVAAADDGKIKEIKKKHCKNLNTSLCIINKIRTDDSEHPEVLSTSGQFSDKTVLLFDDEGLTFNTFLEDVKNIKGAKDIYIFFTHLIASDEARDLIETMPVTKFITTNTTVFHKEFKHDKVVILSVAPLLAEAMRRINNNESISAFLDGLEKQNS